MSDHCPNFDLSYAGCQECPGKVTVTQQDGSVDTICRAGERAVRLMLATVDNNLPVYPIPFPNPEPLPRK